MATDKAHGLLKWLDHNRWLAVTLVVGIVLSALLISCAVKTHSLLVADKMVTAAELEAEIISVQSNYEATMKKAEVAKADLAAKYAVRQQLVGIAGGVAQAALAGELNPITAGAAAIQLMSILAAIGLAVDNRRKDSVIAETKAKTK